MNAASPPEREEQAGWRATAIALVDSPLAGLSPWIAFALIQGPGRLEIGALVALLFAFFFFGLGRLRGRSVKVLELADIVFFGALAIVVAFASDSTQEWLELWGGEVANIALVVIAIGSIVVREPFTIQYAREEAPEEVWDTPLFLHINYTITWAWAIAFAIGAASGFYGDQFLEDSNNVWTGWVIQTGALILAAQFTQWYPDRAEARFAREQGETADEVSIAALLVPLTGWTTAVGIIIVATGEGPSWLGIGLIVVGSLLTRQLAGYADGDG